MIKILFICHGNICRSPMGEFILKEMVAGKGLADKFIIDSAATSREEIGNDIYPPAKAIMREKGIPFERRRARQITPEDYSYYDHIIVMDDNNIRNMTRIFGEDVEGKCHKMLEYAGSIRDVADPWYTGNFEATYSDLVAGCKGLLDEIL